MRGVVHAPLCPPLGSPLAHRADNSLSYEAPLEVGTSSDIVLPPPIADTGGLDLPPEKLPAGDLLQVKCRPAIKKGFKGRARDKLRRHDSDE